MCEYYAFFWRGYDKMKTILTGLLLLSCWTFAGASPYFRVMSHDATGFHPQINAGAFLDPFAIGTESGGGMMVPIVTHSPKDGCFFPWHPQDFCSSTTTKRS